MTTHHISVTDFTSRMPRLTAAVDSTAETLDQVIEEKIAGESSERHGRLVDHDPASSFEYMKQGGYF